MGAGFKVGRHRWSLQKKLAVWLGIALVVSLGLSLFSRRTDLHDREGGHFEHDHRRVFDHRTGAMGRSRDTGHGGHDAHSSDLTRRTGPTFSKHATTFGFGERDDDPFVARSPPRKSGWMRELWDETKHLTYEMAGLAEDDWDFESEMARRPKELDDEELDEEFERADDKQQKMFDKEATTSRYAPRTF